MSFFTELKRRNVIRVALAYLVASWVLLQVTDVLMQILDLPAATGKFVFLVLVLGFVPALVASWVYEMTPEGLRKDTGITPGYSKAVHTGQKLDRITLVLALVAIGVVVVDRLIPEQTVAPSTAEMEQVAPVDPVSTPAEINQTDRISSLAVLPFANMSPDADNEYFADGISEEMLNALVDIEGLRVPSRTSSFAFKGQNRDIRYIASQLDVDYVLEGSVRKSGDRVRITAQLIDVKTDMHLWSETYDRKLEDIFAIQDEIASHIIEALKVTLALGESQPPTTNVEAYTLYLQGREMFRRRGDSLQEADRLLRSALEIDQDFADAWAMLAMVQITIPGYTKEAWADFLEPTFEYARRALELDPSQAEAMLAIGEAKLFQGDLMGSLKQFESLTGQHPRHSQARLWYAISLLKFGYTAQAFEQLSVAMDLDPVHSTIIDWFARAAEAAGRPELVVQSADLAIELGRAEGGVPLIYHYLNNGSATDIAPSVISDLNGDRWVFEVFKVRDDPARLPEALSWTDQFKTEGAGFMAEYVRFNLYLVAGSPTDFFTQVNRIQKVDDTIPAFIWMPVAKRHRQDEAMKTWARNSGYEALWRIRGWPDHCRAVGEDDWECD